MTIPVDIHRRRLVLELLADAGEQGYADPAFIARYTPELYHLIRDGLATAHLEIKSVHGQPLEVARIRITDEGAQEIEKLSSWRRPDRRSPDGPSPEIGPPLQPGSGERGGSLRRFG